MIILLFFLILLCLCGISISRRNDNSGYLSKETTNSIKGIFIIIVFFSHIKRYVLDAGYSYHGLGDQIFQMFMGGIGQLMVVMFLFYSGYGVSESIKKKRVGYVRLMPRHRILNTLLNFDVAVCLFLIVDLLLAKHVTLSQVLLSLIAWDTIGNSNWYIFVILICYLITWMVGIVINPKYLLPQIAWGVLMLAIVTVFILFFTKESWWYNTMLAYPAGMMYSSYKEKVEKYANENYASILILLLVLFVVCNKLPFGLLGLKNNSVSVLFAFLIVVLTMRVKIGNAILRWCGENLFPFYIYQRIPMMVFAAILPSWMLIQYPLVYILFCLLGTIVIAFLYKFIKISF